MMQSNVKKLIAGLLAVTAVLVMTLHVMALEGIVNVGGVLASVTGQDEEPQSSDDVLAATNCRYGVGYVPDFTTSLSWIPTLDAGWYINFNASTWGETVYSAAFAPVLRMRQVLTSTSRTPNYVFNPPLVYSYRDNNGVLRDGLGALIAKNPGHYWIVGNEVDVDNPVQDNTMPDVYARAYHEAYQYIKNADPTAKVAVAGLSMMTPGRLHYLSIVWDTYRSLYGHDMPVDIWNMHLYILEERNPEAPPPQYGNGKIALGTDPALAKLTSFGNPAFCPAFGAADTDANDPRPDVHCMSEHDSVRIFREQVYGMRQWMKAHGQQNKPLIISEYGLLYYKDDKGNLYPDEHNQIFHPQRVANYLRETVKFLEETKSADLGYPADENRLVQQWLWYSIVTDPQWSGGSSNLINWDTYKSFPEGDPGALTIAGQVYQQQANAHVGQSNLVGGVASNVVALTKQGQNASPLLTASFRNSGTLSVIQPVKVTFYSNAALTNEIGFAIYNPTVSGAVMGCTWGGRNSDQVSVVWSNLAPGTYNYWAKVDTLNAVTETSESDNVTTQGTVTVRSSGVLVPVVTR